MSIWASNTWFFMALAAAVSWGLAYTLLDKILRTTPFDSQLLLFSLCLIQAVVLGIALVAKGGVAEMVSKSNISLQTVGLFAICATAFIAGNLLVFHSIQLKNAVLVNLIEITYPVFTFLFTWLLLRDSALTIHTAIGGMMIMGGVAIIFLKS